MASDPPTNEELKEEALRGANKALIGGESYQVGQRQIRRVPLKDAVDFYKLQAHLAERDALPGTGGFLLASLGGAG